MFCAILLCVVMFFLVHLPKEIAYVQEPSIGHRLTFMHQVWIIFNMTLVQVYLLINSSMSKNWNSESKLMYNVRNQYNIVWLETKSLKSPTSPSINVSSFPFHTCTRRRIKEGCMRKCMHCQIFKSFTFARGWSFFKCICAPKVPRKETVNQSDGFFQFLSQFLVFQSVHVNQSIWWSLWFVRTCTWSYDIIKCQPVQLYWRGKL